MTNPVPDPLPVTIRATLGRAFSTTSATERPEQGLAEGRSDLGADHRGGWRRQGMGSSRWSVRGSCRRRDRRRLCAASQCCQEHKRRGCGRYQALSSQRAASFCSVTEGAGPLYIIVGRRFVGPLAPAPLPTPFGAPAERVPHNLRQPLAVYARRVPPLAQPAFPAFPSRLLPLLLAHASPFTDA